MTEYGILELIIFVIVFSLGAGALVYYILLNSKREALVIKYGFYYNSVVDLNREYIFDNYRNSFIINHSVNSKKALENLVFDNVVIYYLENNKYDFKTNLEIILNNKNKYSEYNKKYSEIVQTDFEYNDEVLVGGAFKTIDQFKAFDYKKSKMIKYRCNFSLMVRIYASYISPRGHNSYRRYAFYDLNNVISCNEKAKKLKEYQISTIYERSIMTNSLRYDIFKRDGFRCKICGATANDGAKLHVDHIVPVSKGGKTIPSNLQTLCERCNLGKGNKI